MEIECTGRQVAITKNLRALVAESAARIGKILGRASRAHVILTTEKHRYIAEVNVTTRASSLTALCESSLGMETALREALAKAESQAVRYKNKLRSKKRQPKADKVLEEAPLKRASGAADTVPAVEAKAARDRYNSPNGASPSQPSAPVTVHSFPARLPAAEPHIVRSTEQVALRPMTIEEAVKEAEFRDHEVFVFRDNEGNVKVLHRKRDGKMELIEAP